MDRRYGRGPATASVRGSHLRPGPYLSRRRVGTEGCEPAWAARISLREMTLLAELVDASARVAETSARSQKVAILAGLLASLEPHEAAIAAGLLSGAPRQGRVGVGYATVYRVECDAADEPSLTLDDLDAAISEIQGAAGTGSVGRRREVLLGVLARATEPEAAFVRRLLTGELRQGALAGVMVDAVAKAAGVPAELARRALMLSGDLTRT